MPRTNKEIIERVGFATYPNETEEELEKSLQELINKGHITKENVDYLKTEVDLEENQDSQIHSI